MENVSWGSGRSKVKAVYVVINNIHIAAWKDNFSARKTTVLIPGADI